MSIPRRLDISSFGEGLPELLSFGRLRAPSGGVNSLGVVKVTDGAKAHLIASVPAAKICVTADMLAAKALAARLSGYCDGRVAVLPPRDDVLVYRRGFSAARSRERAAALAAFLFGEADTLVVSAESLMQLCPSPEVFGGAAVLFEKNAEMSPTTAADRLAAAGYSRQEMIADEGDFALRGDRLDI